MNVMKLLIFIVLSVSCSSRLPMAGESISSEAMVKERSKKGTPRDMAETFLVPAIIGTAVGAAAISK